MSLNRKIEGKLIIESVGEISPIYAYKQDCPFDLGYSVCDECKREGRKKQRHGNILVGTIQTENNVIFDKEDLNNEP